MWTPAPRDVIALRDCGSGNMGSLSDEASVGRFSLDRRYVLVYLRAHFDGTGTADLSLSVDSRLGSANDCTLWTSTGRGGSADAFIRVEPGEFEKYTFQVDHYGRDVLVIRWTNPGTVLWGLEVGLAYAS